MEIVLGIACGVLLLFLLVCGYVITNLTRKVEKYEDSEDAKSEILAGYLSYLERISQVIELSDGAIKKLDHKGSFQSDDEIGFFFKNIKDIQTILNEFKLELK
jgi:Na+-transporting methylmalonyl-CoA/oxaloacetate decarboxylase gamma subunit